MLEKVQPGFDPIFCSAGDSISGTRTRGEIEAAGVGMMVEAIWNSSKTGA
jgi:hypothetical protein